MDMNNFKSQSENFGFFLSKSLWKISSGDYAIIATCDSKIQRHFLFIGLLILGIAMLSFSSCTSYFLASFGGFYLAIFLGGLLAWAIMLIYLLLLITLERNMLPHVDGGVSKKISDILRVGAIAFIAVFIAKPMEVVIFEEKTLAVRKMVSKEQFNQSSKMIAATYEPEIEKLENDIYLEEEFMDDCDYHLRVEQLRRKIKELEKKKEKEILLIRDKLASSNFFYASLLLLGIHYPYTWSISLLVLMIFVTPILLKMMLSKGSSYYKRKRRIEMDWIEESYAIFKHQYQHIFKEELNLEVEFYENYTDPPYNTQLLPKKDRKLLTETDLLTKIYGDTN